MGGKHMKSKKALSLLLALTMTITLFVGCSKKAEDTTTATPTTAGVAVTTEAAPTAEVVASGEPITLKLACMGDQADTFENLKIGEAYKLTHPNVTIELEKFKDSGTFEDSLKIRASAGQLPDISTLKPYMLSRFAESMVDLKDLDATAKNLYATGYAVDGKVVGVPDQATREYVYYWKSMFTDLGIEVPTTWDEFIAAAVKIKDAGKVIPIIMGGKDAWPDYPFNEYMPALESQDGFIWTTMAHMDKPFAADQPFSIAYHKLQKLYDAQVMGVDPLGLGFDQAKVMFGQKQGAMMAAGVWAYADIKTAAGDAASDIGAFLLPTRDTKTDDFVTISQADVFLSIASTSENVDAAKEFINWYYSDAWYPAYIQSAGFVPTVDGVEGKYEDLFVQALALQPNAKIVVYDGGGTDFNSIVTETKFDVKVLGQEMMIPGFDLDKKLSDLNDSWTKARASLGIK